MGIDRRSFIRNTAAGAAAVGVGLAGPFQGFAASPDGRHRRIIGYGPLVPTPDEFDGVVRLELPNGFHYRSFHHAGSLMSDGTVLPGRHDGMAAFKAGRHGRSILVRNHEVNGPVGAFGPVDKAYDPMTGGGTVSVVVDAHGNVIRDWVSCNGTQMNCAGGRTPWGSWITCEETVNGDDVGADFTGAPNAGLRKHGYIYEVPSRGESDRVPIRSAGRFAHEAAACHPGSGAVFLTEDNFAFPSGFYRYTPPADPRAVGSLRDGGVLHMLKIKGVDNADMSIGHQVGKRWQCEWVRIDDPDPTFAPGTTNDQAIVAVGDQGRAKGAAIFSRLEGAIFRAGTVYFTSTQGGPTADGDSAPDGFGDGRGQVWAYHTGRKTLELVYQSPRAAVLDLPDNITVSRQGSLLLCEDGSGDNFLRGLTNHGELFDFARNADPAQVGQEFAGATFSHTGDTLYVNIQSSTGYSLAIWGPWDRGPF